MLICFDDEMSGLYAIWWTDEIDGGGIAINIKIVHAAILGHQHNVI